MKNIKVIAFDADDTLWINEPYFKETELEFCRLLQNYHSQDYISKKLFDVEMNNLALYGFGVKSFTLTMIETALLITNNKLDPFLLKRIIDLGKAQLERPIELIDGIQNVLSFLQEKYKLIVATKGDLLDQKRKLLRSGLEQYFSHIEIMPDKQHADYARLLKRLECIPSEFLMIGNSLKSDIIPILELDSFAIHVPYHVTWEYEEVKEDFKHPRLMKLKKISELVEFL